MGYEYARSILAAVITGVMACDSGAASVVGPPPGVQIVYRTNFASGTLDETQNGFAFTGARAVSIVKDISLPGSEYSARFDVDSDAQLDFGGLNLTEVYIQWKVWYPDGKDPRLGPKFQPTGTRNDKLIRLWGTSAADYEVSGVGNSNKVGASTWGTSVGIEYRWGDGRSEQWDIGRCGGGNVGCLDSFPLITDAIRGRWVKIGFHAKMASSANNDGVAEIYVDGKLLTTGSRALSNFPFGPRARRVFTNGYLYGALGNAPQPGARLYVGEFTVSTGGFPD